MANRKRPGMTKDTFQKVDRTEVLKNQLLAIDNEVKKFVYQIVNDVESNPDYLYLKTEFKFMTYNLLVFSKDTNATVGKSWPIIDFLQMGAKNQLEMELNIVVKKLLLEVKDIKNTSTDDETKWI